MENWDFCVLALVVFPNFSQFIKEWENWDAWIPFTSRLWGLLFRHGWCVGEGQPIYDYCQLSKKGWKQCFQAYIMVAILEMGLPFQTHLSCFLNKETFLLTHGFAQNFLKGAPSGLRQIFGIESRLKMMKNAFSFTSKCLFVLKIFKFLSWFFGHTAKQLD